MIMKMSYVSVVWADWRYNGMDYWEAWRLIYNAGMRGFILAPEGLKRNPVASDHHPV